MFFFNIFDEPLFIITDITTGLICSSAEINRPNVWDLISVEPSPVQSIYLTDLRCKNKTAAFWTKNNYLFLSVLQIKVRMRPKPWSKRWERPKFNIQGIRFDLSLTPEQMEHAQKWAQPWLEYDMLKEYDTSKLEEQIIKEVQQEMSKWNKQLFFLLPSVQTFQNWKMRRSWMWSKSSLIPSGLQQPHLFM